MTAVADQVDVTAGVEPMKPAPSAHGFQVSRSFWMYLLLAGGAIWLLATLVTWLTHDDILAPTVIMVGSFLVPLAVVAFALARRPASHLTMSQVVVGFLAAGTLAVVL